MSYIPLQSFLAQCKAEATTNSVRTHGIPITKQPNLEKTQLRIKSCDWPIGFMPMAAVVGKELSRYKLAIIGTTEKCTDQFYAISGERRLTHPTVVLITESAQRQVFK